MDRILRLSKKHNVIITIWYEPLQRACEIKIKKNNNVISRMISDDMMYRSNIDLLEFTMEKMIEDLEKIEKGE